MITYRNIVKFQKDKFPQQVQIAQDFLRTLYSNVDFEGINYIFSSNYVRSRYYRNKAKTGKYLKPNVCIKNDGWLWLYKKKSLKLATYDLHVGNYIQVICSLIHELTHHIQYNENRSRSELETTRNEVEFLRLNYPLLYNKLKEV